MIDDPGFGPNMRKLADEYYTPEPPTSLIITISKGMYQEKGYRNWLRNFLEAMTEEASEKGTHYWLKLGSQPRMPDLQYVYLVIGGKIRFRCYYGGSQGAGGVKFNDGREMFGNAWLVCAGPVTRPPHPIKMNGFRGFRYSQTLF